MTLDEFLVKLEEDVVKNYSKIIAGVGKMTCRACQNQEIQSIGKPVFHSNHHNLLKAFEEISKDIRFIIERRKQRMSPTHPSLGKIAGIIGYRLSRSHIIHLYEGCAVCEYQCASRLNYEFAARTALEYIGIPYLRIKTEIRKEMLYSLLFRHVNQETLSLVFDTLCTYVKK